MQIRAEQMQAFSNAATADFENRLAAHLHRFFPEACQSLEEAGVRERIRYGISAAGTYDIMAERDVCKYIDVMFTLGWHFDRDPQFPWAYEILTDASVEDPAARIESLCDAVECYAASQSPSED
jgi:hypothetical protein